MSTWASSSGFKRRRLDHGTVMVNDGISACGTWSTDLVSSKTQLDGQTPHISLARALYPGGQHCEGTVARSEVIPENRPNVKVFLPASPHERSTKANSMGFADIGERSQELVCFGMIEGITVHCVDCNEPPPATEELQLIADDETDEVAVVSGAGKEVRGRVRDDRGTKFLTALADPEVTLQLQLRLSRSANTRDIKNRTIKRSLLDLAVIIYGSPGLYDEIGDFCQDYEYYLQDPIGCTKNVYYRNPHRISSEDEGVPLTFELQNSQDDLAQVVESQSLLAGLHTEAQFAEATQPKGLKTQLFPHQLQALTFMKSREAGWALSYNGADLWSRSDAADNASSSGAFINNITGNRYFEPPPTFRGGILADDMGLGKTLTAIALIASEDHQPRIDTEASREGHYSAATLLVVPPSLIEQWESQLSQHLQPQSSPVSLRWLKHYGSRRLSNSTQLATTRIVLTSYHTLVAEHKRKHLSDSVLFLTNWHRVVLDEAHTIRNQQTATAKAIQSLKANCRWAVTGTPIQNRLPDLYSLIAFLRAYPYCHRENFDGDIVDVWRAGDEQLGLVRLKRLFGFLAIRRPRSSIKLPDRSDFVRHLDFTPEEKDEYQQLETPIARMLDSALRTGIQATGFYMNALVKINALRKFCNIGATISNPSRSQSPFQLVGSPNSHSGLESIMEDLAGSGQGICTTCSSNLAPLSDDDTEKTGSELLGYLSDCLRLMCRSCVETRSNASRKEFVCDIHQGCHFLPISFSTATNTELLLNINMQSKPLLLSSKLIGLRKELLAHNGEKSVVFSSWSTTLDTIEKMLRETGIHFSRISGNITPKRRAQILQDFRTNPSIRVMLITIGCGAEGLNLTCASRVYLMEPQWNPNVEEQALARVHRLGQTRPVATVRFVMRNSIEDHVMNIQDRKRHLADLLSNQQKGDTANSQRERLKHLRDLLS